MGYYTSLLDNEIMTNTQLEMEGFLYTSGDDF